MFAPDIFPTLGLALVSVGLGLELHTLSKLYEHIETGLFHKPHIVERQVSTRVLQFELAAISKGA